MNRRHDKHRALIPYQTLVLATQGDIDAIETVIRHYKGYIITLAMKQVYDQYGDSHCIVDDVLRGRLEAKLITTILNFKIA